MRAGRIGRTLRLAGPALAAAAVVAAGGSVAGPARAGEQACDEGSLWAGDASEAPPSCVETVPPETETGPAEEPPPGTETVVPVAPPPVAETTPAERGAVKARERPVPPAPGAPAGTPPAPATSPVPGGGIFGTGPHSGTPELSGGPYVFPVIGATSFADTWGAPRATVAWHHGVDIFAALGAPIVAVADGTLFSVGWNRIGGQRLWLRDRDGNYFYYAHLSSFAPISEEGARVRLGEVVGYVGTTGDAEGTPPHLHFEIHPVSLLSLGYDGAVNPFPYVSSWPRLDAAGELVVSGAAPTPGAILLGFTDISSASGLAPGSLEATLDEDAVATAVAYEPERPEATTASADPPDDHAQIARSLDAEAARGALYPVSIWDMLALCESGGDWGANTGNGYIGGLQFLPTTWASHGGPLFAPSPHLATREQQIAIAKRVLESQGWRAWPACSSMLGLPELAGQ
jgi:hypothetical protein